MSRLHRAWELFELRAREQRLDTSVPRVEMDGGVIGRGARGVLLRPIQLQREGALVGVPHSSLGQGSWRHQTGPAFVSRSTVARNRAVISRSLSASLSTRLVVSEGSVFRS